MIRNKRIKTREILGDKKTIESIWQFPKKFSEGRLLTLWGDSKERSIWKFRFRSFNFKSLNFVIEMFVTLSNGELKLTPCNCGLSSKDFETEATARSNKIGIKIDTKFVTKIVTKHKKSKQLKPNDFLIFFRIRFGQDWKI